MNFLALLTILTTLTVNTDIAVNEPFDITLKAHTLDSISARDLVYFQFDLNECTKADNFYIDCKWVINDSIVDPELVGTFNTRNPESIIITDGKAFAKCPQAHLLITLHNLIPNDYTPREYCPLKPSSGIHVGSSFVPFDRITTNVALYRQLTITSNYTDVITISIHNRDSLNLPVHPGETYKVKVPKGSRIKLMPRNSDKFDRIINTKDHYEILYK